jgi:hypothetical protein
VALASVAASAGSNEVLEGGRMNPRRQPAPLGGKPSDLHSQPPDGEHGGRGQPMGAWGKREASPTRELEPQVVAEPEGRSGAFLRTVCFVLATGVCYYVATQIAWALCFPNSKVSLFFPPHAVLVSILLMVPTQHWWAYLLAAASAHFLATQLAHWPPLYALHCEVFDAVQNVATAAGIRIFIKSPLKALTLRDALNFVLIAVVLVPFGTAFWGAAFTVSSGFGTHYWIEWRNLGLSNAVTAVVLVPALLLGAYHLLVTRPKISYRRVLEAALLCACTAGAGILVFDQTPAGPGHFAASVVFDHSWHSGIRRPGYSGATSGRKADRYRISHQSTGRILRPVHAGAALSPYCEQPGAQISIKYAARHQEKVDKLVLICPSGIGRR